MVWFGNSGGVDHVCEVLGHWLLELFVSPGIGEVMPLQSVR